MEQPRRRAAIRERRAGQLNVDGAPVLAQVRTTEQLGRLLQRKAADKCTGILWLKVGLNAGGGRPQFGNRQAAKLGRVIAVERLRGSVHLQHLERQGVVNDERTGVVVEQRPVKVPGAGFAEPRLPRRFVTVEAGRELHEAAQCRVLGRRPGPLLTIEHAQLSSKAAVLRDMPSTRTEAQCNATTTVPAGPVGIKHDLQRGVDTHVGHLSGLLDFIRAKSNGPSAPRATTVPHGQEGSRNFARLQCELK